MCHNFKKSEKRLGHKVKSIALRRAVPAGVDPALQPILQKSLFYYALSILKNWLPFRVRFPRARPEPVVSETLVAVLLTALAVLVGFLKDRKLNISELLKNIK